MGYILPVHSYQSQQYANRLRENEYNYSKVNQLHRINQISDFMEDFDEKVDEKYVERKNEKGMQEKPLASSPSQHEVIGYVNPSPINISVKNVPIVQKDAAINAYS